VTRVLLNHMTGSISDRMFKQAKEILSTKCVVGLLDQLVESVRRFDLYFGFSTNNEECKMRYLQQGTNRHSHPGVPPKDSSTYRALVEQNEWDIKLYEHAQQLFAQQAPAFQ